jgi:hypothetical protein
MNHKVARCSFYLAFLFTALVFSGCENEALEDAASMDCSFKLDRLTAANGKLIIDDSYLHMTSANIKGLRDGSEDINASKNFTSTQGTVRLNGDDPLQPLRIPVPSGSYSQVTITLMLHQDNYALVLRDTVFGEPNNNGGNGGDDDGDGDDGDDDNGTGGNDTGGTGTGGTGGYTGGTGGYTGGTGGSDSGSAGGTGGNSGGSNGSAGRAGKTVDLADYLRHGKPSMLIAGTYTDGSTVIKVLVALDHSPVITFSSANTTPDTLVLNKNSSHAALASFNTAILFQHITPAIIESADLINYRGTAVFIHRDFNTTLFTAIDEKLQASASLQVSQE